MPHRERYPAALLIGEYLKLKMKAEAAEPMWAREPTRCVFDGAAIRWIG